MTIQTRGAISINDLHVEAGGTTNTTVSISDADVRGLISKGVGATASISEWYGASATQSITATASSYVQANQYVNARVMWHSMGSSTNTNGLLIQTTATNNNNGQTQWGPESDNGTWNQLVGGLVYSRNWANVRFAQASYQQTGQTYHLSAGNSDFARSGDYIEMYYNGTLIITLNQKYEEPTGSYYPLTFYNSSMTNFNMINNRTNASLWQMKYIY